MSIFLVHSAVDGLVSLLNPADGVRRTTGSLPHDVDSTAPDAHVHDDEPKRTFQCADCLRHFTTMGHLNRHRSVHTGIKNYVCPVPDCSKRTSRHDNLVQHFRMHLLNQDRNCSTSLVRQAMGSMTVKARLASPRTLVALAPDLRQQPATIPIAPSHVLVVVARIAQSPQESPA